MKASDRCGLESTRYGQQGFVLTETSTKAPIGIFYSAIQNTIRWQEPCGLEFCFEDDRGLFRVEIIGGTDPNAPELMRRLQLRLITGKRESLWANGSVVKQIRITQVEEDAEEAPWSEAAGARIRLRLSMRPSSAT